MCGFIGCVSFKEIESANLQKANSFSKCRGPDDTSQLTHKSDINYDLWFNRLAIVDLNSNANQPMVSESQGSVLMFNGEIYNSNKLRKKNTEYNFLTSHSDTETLLAGLDQFGINFINELEGQFSFFYMNKIMKKIYLVRDRVGQKPLYFSCKSSSLNFASNLKSLLIYEKKFDIDQESIDQYISFGVNFSPTTLFKDIFKLSPGTFAEVDYSTGKFILKTKEYWNPKSFIDEKPFNQSEFIEILSDSVEKRTIADVEIANFLSGGIDSTSIVKNLHDLDKPINTFSVIMNNDRYNEKEFIDEVVKKFNTNHSEVLIDEKLSNDLITKSLQSLDEPYGDPSVVPSFYLSNLISSEFKVAISGDGGDELLGGYKRLKNFFSNKNALTNFISIAYKIYPSFLGTGTNLQSKNKNKFIAYKSFLEDKKFNNLLREKDNYKDINMNNFENEINYKDILLFEYEHYLSDQMMFKVDRTSMANSLEVRSPFVDHNLIEYIFSHSNEYLTTGIQKEPLRNYLSANFDENFLDRPKQGFVFDYQSWVYSNIDYIFEIVMNSKINTYISLNSLNKIKLVKSRINALRIWRIFVLANYLNEINDL